MSLHSHLLPYSLFPMFIIVDVCYCYYVCEIGVWEYIHDIVLACWKVPPHIYELVGMLQRGERTLSPTLGSGAGGCVLGTTLCALVMGDEHLWRVPDYSGGNFSRGVVEEAILVMGIDCRPC